MSSEQSEIQSLKKRFNDLADKSSRQGIFTFTHFLSLPQQDVFFQIEKDLKYVGYSIFGGFEAAERKIVRFGNVDELGYEVDFPIKCIYIKPVQAKFADKLSHRDFLGAIMNLGIKRETIGDIKVGDNAAYVFCLEEFCEFICENLYKIKHTNVECREISNISELPKETPENIKIQVASLRIDAIIAKVYNKSRSDCIDFFKGGKVFVDSRLCENNSRILKPNEIVNVRGFGKFIMCENVTTTKKGKFGIEIILYK